jgi:hypothetical protein
MNDKLVTPITNDELMLVAKNMVQNKMPNLDS